VAYPPYSQTIAHPRIRPLQPFSDQAEHPRIGHTVLDELHCPFVVHVVKEPSNVQVSTQFTRLAGQPTISASNASCWLRPVGVLPSPPSAVGRLLLTLLCSAGSSVLRPSRPSTPCAPDVRLNAFSGRPAVLLSGDAEVSRFSCMKFLSVHGPSDYAGSAADSRYRLLRCNLPHPPTGSASVLSFRSSYRPTNASVYASKDPLAAPPGKTRAQDGSLLLSCETLSFSASCRFIPALGRKRIALTFRTNYHAMMISLGSSRNW